MPARSSPLFWLYTPDIERVGVIEKYISMIWTRRHHAAGAFQLTMPFVPLCKDLITERLVVKGNEAGIIENVNIAQDEQTGENVFVCSGRFLSSYLDRRVVNGTNSYNGTPEDAMRYLVTKHATVGDRAIEHLSVAPSGGIVGSVEYISENKNLLSEIETLSEAYALGFYVSFAANGFSFHICPGVDRTAEQSINPRAIFSVAFENVLKQEYDASTKKVRNVAFVDARYQTKLIVYDAESQSEKEIIQDHTFSRTVGSAAGRARREVYVNAGDVTEDDNNNVLTAAQRNAAADAAGQAKLVSATQAFMVDVDPHGNLLYKQDYDLGDIVTVDARELGMRVNARITEIKEIYEGEGQGLVLTLGYGVPSFDKYVRWIAGTNG